MPFVCEWLHTHTRLSDHIDKTNFVFSRPSSIYPTNSIYDNFVLTLSRCKKENCSRTIRCSCCFDGCSQSCCSFSNTRWCCCKMMSSPLQGTKAITDHFQLPRSRLFMSEVRYFTSLNSVFRLTHIVRTMTTPLKDSVESLR